MTDSYGDGWSGNVFTLWTAADSDGDGVMEYTEYFSATLPSGSTGTAYIPGLDDVFGCTDPNASNYDANATVDDGSCVTTCDLMNMLLRLMVDPLIQKFHGILLMALIMWYFQVDAPITVA